jgi:hypothetical protein
MREKETIGKKILRQSMSSNEKAKMREKETIGKKILRQSMSSDEKAKMRKKETIGRKRLRDGMSPDENTKMREKETIGRKRLRNGMSSDKKDKMREKAKNTINRLRDGMYLDEKVKMREKETIGRKRLRGGISSDEKVKMRRKERNDFECMKEAKKCLHRTQDHDNPHKHKSIVCVICDRFIIGTEKNHHLSKDNVGAHSQRLSVKSYKRYYETVLVPEVRKQYMINDGNLKDLLLSPCARKNHNGYSAYS